MCFVLYIATATPMPVTQWNEQSRAVYIAALSDSEQGAASHFRNPNVYYVGSDKGCGCGFRNAHFQNGSWPEEEWRQEGDTSYLEAQPNHEQLVAYLKGCFPQGATVEFYGMWEGDLSAPAMSHQSISLSRILDIDFYFRDGGFYVVEFDRAEH